MLRRGTRPHGDFEALCKMVLTLYTEDPEGEPVTVDKIRLTVREAVQRPDKLTIVMIEVSPCTGGNYHPWLRNNLCAFPSK